MSFSGKTLGFLGLIGLSCIGSQAVAADWDAKDKIDYHTRLLDGCDGGSGAWVNYWRSSGEGGMMMVDGALLPGFPERHARVTSTGTAGVYRDMTPLMPASDERLTLWVAFAAKAEGAPYDASGDEASFQLRGSDNTEWITVGVMGRLNEWRLRLVGDGQYKIFSDGAGRRPDNQADEIVLRIDIDLRPGSKDSVALWLNPKAGSAPGLKDATILLNDADLWKPGSSVSISRLRVGLINAQQQEQKGFSLSNVRMATSYAATLQ